MVRIGIVYAGGPAHGDLVHREGSTIRLMGPSTDLSQQVAGGQMATFRVLPGTYTASARSGNAQCADLKVEATIRTTTPLLVRCDVK